MTSDTDLRFIPFVLRTLAGLLALLGAPARAWRRYVRLKEEQRVFFELLLKALARRGVALRYEGEDDATVEKRLRIVENLVLHPRKALRHLARLARAGAYIFSVPERALNAASPSTRPRDQVCAAPVNERAPLGFDSS